MSTKFDAFQSYWPYGILAMLFLLSVVLGGCTNTVPDYMRMGPKYGTFEHRTQTMQYDAARKYVRSK